MATTNWRENIRCAKWSTFVGQLKFRFFFSLKTIFKIRKKKIIADPASAKIDIAADEFTTTVSAISRRKKCKNPNCRCREKKMKKMKGRKDDEQKRKDDEGGGAENATNENSAQNKQNSQDEEAKLQEVPQGSGRREQKEEIDLQEVVGGAGQKEAVVDDSLPGKDGQKNGDDWQLAVIPDSGSEMFFGIREIQASFSIKNNFLLF